MILRFIVLVFILVCSTSSKSQLFKLGIMAGANSSMNQFYTFGDVNGADSKLGYNANAFARIQILKFNVQPELGYLNNRVGISFVENGKIVEGNFSIGQFYIASPIGFKFSKIRVQLGPYLTFSTNQSFDQLTSEESYIEQIDNGDIKVGGLINLGLDISKRWSIDARFARSFTTSEFSSIVQNKSQTFEGNTGMLSLSIGYTLFKTK